MECACKIVVVQGGEWFSLIVGTNVIMKLSTHKVEVVRLNKIEPHPNADKMEIARVFGYVCCIGKGQFKVGDLAAYIPPDSIVPDTEQFKFLEGHHRIRVRKLRGIVSQGLLIEAPKGAKEGDDVAATIGVVHYEPPPNLRTGGQAERPPSVYAPYYDIDSYYRYPNLLADGEEVIVTEKIHGANARYCWHNGRMWCGSHGEWKREDDNIVYWRIAHEKTWLAEWCKAHPDIVVYGEIYGAVQKNYSYGVKSGDVDFMVFDVMRGNNWIEYDEKFDGLKTHWVPLIYRGPFNRDEVIKMSNGQSLINGAANGREGVVIRPAKERTCPEIGRVILKIVGSDYLLK